MPTILIGGYYGAGNVGDEAILYAILSDLRNYDSALNFIILSKDPEKTKAEHNVEVIDWEDINALLDAALRSDLIILGGGGIFHDYWGIDPDKYLRKGFWDITAFGSLPLLAKLLNIPCVILAVGVGPFKSELGREHTRLAFERSQFATVRDNESMDFLRETGLELDQSTSPSVSVVPDIVFRFEIRPSDKYDADEFLEEKFSIGSDTPLLGISLRYWEDNAPLHERLSSIALGVKQFLDAQPLVHVILIPFQVLDATPHTDDRIVLREFAKLVDIPNRIHLIETASSPHLVQAFIGRCTAILGMRFHSIVMGINTGTPAVAISYAPKVQAAMKFAGLEEYCNLSLAPDPNELEKQLHKVWIRRSELHQSLLAVRDKLKLSAYGHAQVVTNLIDHLDARPPLEFTQEYALKQIRLLFQAEEQVVHLQGELHKNRQYLLDIESSRLWKLVKVYYRLVEATPLSYLRRFLNFWLSAGWGKALDKLLSKLKNSASKNTILPVPESNQSLENMIVTEDNIKKMFNELSQLSLKGIFVITSSPVDNEIYSQRAINLSKFLSHHGWGIVYITGNSRKSEPVPSLFGKRYHNVFQVPEDIFLNKIDAFVQLPFSNKFFIVDSPHPNFLLLAFTLRSQGFNIIYEITTEWESCHQSHQINWFDDDLEEAFVVNANLVTSASQQLIEKFAYLRQDINIIPNGYSPESLGKKRHRIDYGKKIGNEIQLGYFGNLASSWFDWDFLLSLLTLADAQNVKIQIHLIGYIEPALKAKLEKYTDRVTFYGVVHPAHLYKYVKNWDVALLCLNTEILGETMASIKIYEHIHFGLPVIVKGNEYLSAIPVTEVTPTPSQALEVILDILKNGLKRFEKDQDTLETFLFEADWEQRFIPLLKILEGKKWISL